MRPLARGLERSGLLADPRRRNKPSGTGMSGGIAQAWAALRRGDARGAEAICTRILAARPADAEALHALAILRLRAGRAADAAALCRRAVAAAPGAAPAWSTLGSALQAQGLPAEAIEAHGRAVTLDPALTGARFNLGNALRQGGRAEDAADAYRAVLAQQPEHADALVNLGGLLGDLDRYEEALPVCRQAVAADPGRALAWLNLAVATRALGDMPGTIAALERAVALAPEHAQAQYNLGLARLLTGDLARGFATAEWRRRLPFFAPAMPGVPLPDWPGPGAAGGLLAYGEQGVGEEVLHAGLVPEAAQAARPLVLVAAERLRPLLERSFAGVTVVARSSPPDPRATAPEIAWQYPTASLGAFFRPSLDSFPRRRSYLTADPEHGARLRARYRALGRGPVIGIAWRSVNEKLGSAKTTALGDWTPILRSRDAVFLSLQYGDCAAEIAAMAAHGITIHRDPEIDPLIDLDGFAAQCAAMDLVISVSNTTVHVAGALGVPTWVMLPRSHGLLWYWFLEREDSPWYPSLRLFRQPRQGDWAAVIARIAAALPGTPLP